MDNFLVLVANASKANFYALKFQNSNATFLLKTVFVHPESQEKRSDLIADRSGHYQRDYGTGGAYEYRSDPKKVEKNKFAQELGHYINETIHTGTKLIIITPSTFWGMLDKVLNKTALNGLYRLIQKDYTQYSEQALKELILQAVKTPAL
jgi:protein required for attachment to host cells